MTRETRLGLTVAAAFLLLVGGVLAYKLYLTEDPLLSDLAETQPAPAASAKATSTEEASEGGEGAGGPSLSKAGDAAGAAPPPPEEPPILSGRPVAQADAPPVPGRPEEPPAPEPPAPTAPMRPDGPPPAEENPKPGPALTLTPPAPPPPDEPSGPPVLRPSDIPMSRPVQPETAGVRESGPPAVEPPAPEKPSLGSPPPAPTDASPAGQPPAPLPPLEPPSPPMPGSSPEPASPSRDRSEPPTPAAVANPMPATTPPRTPDFVPPPPPPTTFDRKYEVPVLGRPVVDGQGRSGSGAVPQANPASQRSDSSGIPLTVRPQPGPARSEAGIPVVVQPPVWNTPDGRPPAHVESFDLEVYVWKAGDSYATVSQHRYRSDRYQQALARFNRERDPRLANPQPGMAVYLPPAGYLERRYGVPSPGTEAVSPSRSATNTPTTSPRPSLPESEEGGAIQQVADFRPASPPSPTGTSGGKRYRVRPNDTIWSIAKTTLGSGERWPEILRLNRDLLTDVNRLEAGMVLRLPDDARVDGQQPGP